MPREKQFKVIRLTDYCFALSLRENKPERIRVQPDAKRGWAPIVKILFLSKTPRRREVIYIRYYNVSQNRNRYVSEGAK